MYQPLPTIHGSFGWLGGVRLDRPGYLGRAVDREEVAAELVEPRGAGVAMGVLEPRQQRPAAQLDDPRPRADPLANVAIGADRHDPARSHGDRFRLRPDRVDGVDSSAAEDEVGGGFGRHATAPLRMGAAEDATGGDDAAAGGPRLATTRRGVDESRSSPRANPCRIAS